MKIEATDDDISGSVFEMEGFISNSNYIAKKTTMVLFINGMQYLYHVMKLKIGLQIYWDLSSCMLILHFYSIARMQNSWLRSKQKK